MTFEVKIEDDGNDITEHPHDNRPRPCLCTVCEKCFTTKWYMNQHKTVTYRRQAVFMQSV